MDHLQTISTSQKIPENYNTTVHVFIDTCIHCTYTGLVYGV